MLSGSTVNCGMARPQVADRGDGLHIRRVAGNILNKQLLTVGGPPAWRLGGRLTTPPLQKVTMLIWNKEELPRHSKESVVILIHKTWL
jgi:hypothetical protein